LCRGNSCCSRPDFGTKLNALLPVKKEEVGWRVLESSCCLCLCRTPMQRLCACTHVCVRVRVLRIFGSIQWPLSRRRLRRWQRRMTQGRNSDCRAINAEIDWGADLEPRAYIKLITNMKF